MILHRKNKRGVALILVLSAVTVLTTMGVEFAYNTNIYYNLAQNERNRLQAYYLAKSAYSFMQLELKFDRMFRQVVKTQNLSQYLGSSANLPLCQQFPISTGLIRAVFLNGAIPGMPGGQEGEGEPASEESQAASEALSTDESGEDETIDKMRKETSISQEKSAKEFLQFEGDFDAECIDESTKINLNGFAGLAQTPGAENALSPFDQYKQFIFRFLSEERFKDLFKEADLRPLDVVNNIGDWIDGNNEMNDFDGRSGGTENSLYQKAGAQYKVRNGKLLTLLETYMIDGVIDEWFAPMMDYFTVYGDMTINVCSASHEVVEGLIRRYVDSTPGLPPLRLEDANEMKTLVQAISDGCAAGGTGDQLKQQVAAALDTAIKSISSGVPAPPQNPGMLPQPAPTPQTPGAPETTATTGFAAFISTEPRYYTLMLTGQTGDTTVRIKAAIDVKETDPKKWKLLYWKVY